MSYDDFVATKLVHVAPTGIARVPKLGDHLFPFQKDLVTWALRRGRAAIFADTGLGKTRMQIEWARRVSKHCEGPVLILAPLAVAPQTAREGAAMSVEVRVCRELEDVGAGINVTNYDRLHKFDPSKFCGIVLDESSIIKHQNSKTFAALTEAFGATPFRLCATATPSPNDYTELGTHAEFLGMCTRAEMLAEFFCHDGGETQVWRLKGHARKAFWRWVSSWGALLRKPFDLGYADDGYALPPLNVHHHTLDADAETVKKSGYLFAQEATDLMARRQARRASLSARVQRCADLVNADREPWVVWCDLNDESDELAAGIPDAVEIRGSLDVDEKERRIVDFGEGRTRVLVSKASMTGFGLNWQHCARMAFVGVTDSWEAYYQAVRRCYRFGQTRAVDVHIFASEIEGSVVKNLQRKEADARRMAEELSAETRDAFRAEIGGSVRTVNAYAPGAVRMPAWLTTEAT
jgi:superfamily II DNA or RNA helicase